MSEEDAGVSCGCPVTDWSERCPRDGEDITQPKIEGMSDMDTLDPASRAYLAAIASGDEAEEERLGKVLDTTTQIENIKRNLPGVIQKAAFDLAKSGFHVFPIAPGGKTPLTKHGFFVDAGFAEVLDVAYLCESFFDEVAVACCEPKFGDFFEHVVGDVVWVCLEDHTDGFVFVVEFDACVFTDGYVFSDTALSDEDVGLWVLVVERCAASFTCCHCSLHC